MFLFYNILFHRGKNYWLWLMKLISWSNRAPPSLGKHWFHSCYSHKEIIPLFSGELLSIFCMKILLLTCFYPGASQVVLFVKNFWCLSISWGPFETQNPGLLFRHHVCGTPLDPEIDVCDEHPTSFWYRQTENRALRTLVSFMTGSRECVLGTFPKCNTFFCARTAFHFRSISAIEFLL